ncbi:methyltransferase domain-containing protein [Egibacter rhizosphaerae]|uniref:Methyltransferase domain-containing protein n=1 Tax=Egibacter rhizosphaerae TaxID=1670831 RepID=A0A411YC39_9ACTN|nr:class I SAM-dependent methyltransferase [Egibacter rhizosphaerae]QBI18717.1 methyltransferase domain-containing protein [Egibacter rhizosphaerae]
MLADVMHRLAGEGTVRFSAYDGSTAGPDEAPVHFEVASPRAFAHLVRAPGQIGLARAFVDGEINVHGDMYTLLRELQEPHFKRLSKADWKQLAGEATRHARQRAQRPPEEAKLRGLRHSKRRDAAAISHHYDVSNRFYELVLGPSMTYTCAVFPREDASLEEAQHEKHDLVARKLALRPGMRLLDVGCGWGGMVIHAARHYGVRALGVTLSRAQAEWAQEAIEEAGLADLAEVRYLDYRDVAESDFDAISSIGLTEHIGKANLVGYFQSLYGKLRPGGRLLNHCIMRPRNTDPRVKKRGFINRYVFPDGELMGLGHIVRVMQDEGRFEVRHEENLREHYGKTLAAWTANLNANWDECVAEAGERKARIWRLYMPGCQLAFERDEIQLHQVLAVRTEAGDSGMALRPNWEAATPEPAPSEPVAPAS